jgi:hypothetical protein
MNRVEDRRMCTTKNVDACLEQLQLSQNHKEKRKILEQLVGCVTCKERPDFDIKRDARCKCEIEKEAEFLNSLEHAIRQFNK